MNERIALTEKMKNLNIEEPKFEKWNDLPPELKMECIKELDFTTKCSLRSTSRSERALVDSQRIKFNKVELCCSFGYMLEIEPHDPDHPLHFYAYDRPENVLPILKYILRHGSIDTLQVDNGEPLWSELVGEKKFSVKKLELSGVREDEMEFWLEQMNGKIQSIAVDRTADVGRLLSFSCITNAAFFQISSKINPDYVSQLAQIWIDKDVEIGRTFQTKVPRKAEFFDYFPDRIVSDAPNHIRIRTNNPTKHIFLKLSLSNNSYLLRSEKFLRMTVIPAKTKEMDTRDEWYRALELEQSDYFSGSDED